MNDTPDLPGAPYDFDEAERSVQYANYRAALNLDLDDAATPDWAVDAAYEVFSPNKAGAVPVTPEHKRDALRRYQAFARSGNPADLFDAGRRAWEEAKKQGTDAAIAYIDAHEKKGGLPELGTIVRDLANNPSARYSDSEMIRAGGAAALAAKDEEDERQRRIREYDAQVAARDKEAIIAACLPRLSPDVRRAFDDFVSNGCRFVDGSFDTLLRAGEYERELFGALATMARPSPPNAIGAAAQNLWDAGWRTLWEAPGTLRKTAAYTAGSYLGGLLQTGSLGESAALAGDAYAEYKETRRLRRELLAPKLADYGAFGNTLVDAAGIVGYWAPMGVGTRLAKLGRAVDAAAKGADAAATTGRLYAAAGRGVLKTEQALGRGLSPATRSAIAAGAIRAEPLAAAFTPERVALAAYAIEEREQILDRIIEEGGNAASLWTQLTATGAAIGHAYIENIRWEQWAGAGRHAVEVAKANAYAKLAHALPERVGKLLGTDRIVFTKGAREMARSMAALAIGRDIGTLTFYEALEEGAQQAIEETTVGLFSPHGLSAEQVLGESWKAFYGSIPSMMLTMGFGTARRARGYSQGIYNAEGDGQLLVDAAAATRDAIRNHANPLSRDVESLAPLYGAWTRATTASDRQKLFAQAGIDAVHALELDTAFAEISKAATPAILSETFGSGAVAREAIRILAADSRLEGMRLATDADTGEERLERELTLPNGKTVTLSVASRRVQNIAELSTATETAFSSAREAFSDDEEIARILADTGIDLRKTLAENLAAFDGDQNALDNAFRTATAGLAVRGAATPVSVETDPETGRTIVKADITLTGWAEEETAYHEYGHALQETLQRLGDMTDEQTAALVADLGAPQDATETWNQERGAVGLERLAREDAPRPIPQRPFFQRVARTLRLRALVRDAEPQIKDALDILETAMRTGKFDGWQARSEAQNRVHAARHAASADSAAAPASAADSAAAPSEGDGAAPTPESTALDKFETNQPLTPAEMLVVRNTLGGNIRDATRSILDGGWRWNGADNLWQHFPTLQGRAPDLGRRYFGADGAWHDNPADAFLVRADGAFAMDGTVADALPPTLRDAARAVIEERANTPAWMAEPDGRPTLLPERDWLRREAERYSVTRDAAPTPAELEEARRQYDEVVARYTNGDGTRKPGWMKAPNGKPTRLTERQWVQVRTPNFRNNFFGDWLSLALRDAIEATEPIDFERPVDGEMLELVEGYRRGDAVTEKKIIEWAIGQLPGGPISTPIGPVTISRGNIRSILHHAQNARTRGPLKVLTLPYLARMLEKAVLYDERADGPDYFYNFAHRISFDGVPYIARIIVKREADGGITYDTEFTEEKKLSGALATRTGAPAEAETSPARPTTDTLLKALYQVNPSSVSKVVDENGEPLVVAHSTDAEFTVFRDMQKNDAGWLGAGFYFFGDRSLDGQYGRNVMECFLNVREPYFISDEERDRLAESDDAGTSAEFSEEIRGEGYDGVYYNGDLNREWAVFSPSQVKSATDNTGVFSARPDVRYSVTPAERAPDAAPGGAGGEVPRSSLPAVRGTRPLDFLRNADTITAQQGNRNVQRAQPEPEPDDEFRRLQVEARGMPGEVVRAYHSGVQICDEGILARLRDVLSRRVGAARRRNGYGVQLLTNGKTGADLRIGRVDGATFHDVFEIARQYLKYGDLVDLHDSYGDDVQCWLSDDGLSGFAVEPDGNIVSVFSLGGGGFLRTVFPLIRKVGGRKLDCYALDQERNLPSLYEKHFGFKRASSMAYDESFEPEDPARERHGFGERHGMPRIVFMVADPGHAVEEKTFDGDYDGAVAWQNANLPARSRYSIASTIGGRNVFGVDGQSEAARMAAAGASREDIWRKTGWWKGKDGKWRVEIPDLSLKAHVVETVRDVLDRQAEFSFDRLPTGEEAEGNFGFNVLVADAFILRAERRLWEAAVRDNAEGWRRDLQTVVDAPLESEEFRAGVARMMPLAREVVDGEALEYALRENGNYNFKKIATDLLRFMGIQVRDPSGGLIERDMEQERNRIDEGFRFAAETVVDLGQLAWTDNAPLFRAYSFLRGVPVEFRKLSGAYAQADPTPGRYRITVDADRFRKNPSTLLSSLAHEVQHLIQAEEGLAKGGDVRTAHNAFLDRKNRELETISAARDRAKEELLRMSIPADASAEDRAAFDQARMEKGREVMRLVAKYDETMREKLQRDPFESYRRLAGETEARAVQARLAMTPEERGSTPPWESYDVDEADQVIRYSVTAAEILPHIDGILNGAVKRNGGNAVDIRGDKDAIRRDARRIVETFASERIPLSTGGVLFFAPDEKTVLAYGGDMEKAWAEYAIHLATHDQTGKDGVHYRTYERSNLETVLPKLREVVKTDKVKLERGAVVFYQESRLNHYIRVVTNPVGDGDLRVDLAYKTGMERRGRIPGQTTTLGDAMPKGPAEGTAQASGRTGILPQTASEVNPPRHSVVPRLWAFDPGRLPSSIRWGTLNGHDGNIVGLVAMSRLAGRRMDSESISQLARRLGVKMSASEIRQKADDLLKGDMADLAARLAGGGDVAGAVAALSAAAEPRTSDHALIRQAFAAGAKRGQAAEKMRSRVASAVLEAQRGADLAEITREFGFDVAAILHSWTNEVEKREGPDKDIAPLPDPLSALSALEDPDGTKAEDAAARLAQTRAEIAERFQQLFAETRRLANAREELAKAREEKEETQAPAAGSVPGAEASGEAAAQNPDDLSDIPGALDPATLPIPYELLAQNGIDLRDAPTFALALRVGIREMLWKQDPAYDGTPFGAGLRAEPLRESEHRLWANPTALDQYRKSMIAILTDMADKLLDHGSVAYRRAREAATHIATDCTADQIERDTADVLRGISQNSIRQTTRATVAELRAELKTGFIDQTTTLDSDYVRKQTGEIGKRAAWIHKVLGMTSGQADAALDALERELATRAALYDEAIKSGDATTLAVDDDQRYREALWKKADLEAYRDTLRLLPGAAKAVCDTIRDWMKTSAAEWARRSIAYERDMERKRAAILEAVRNVREDGSDIVHESDSAADRRYLRFVNTLDQRLRDIFRFSRGDARERADAVRDEWHLKVARATETYETRMQRAQEFFSRAVNDVTGGHGLEWLKHMEEEIPEEQAERLSREGRRHLTYGQILHLYGYLCQTGDYADNIHRHGRDGQRAYIEREVLTPEDIAVFSRLRDYYADTRDEISDAKKEQTGIGFGAADPWYAPVKIATPARDGAPVEASTWNLMPEIFSERRRHALDVDETGDALALFWDRAEESSRMIAYGGLGVEFLHTLCNGKVKAAIRRFHGARELSELLAHVGDTLAGGHSIPGAYRGDDVEWIGRLRTAVTHVALCGNLSPALKQTVSAPVFALARERGIGSVFRDMLSIGTPEWRAAYREWSQSDGYRARYGSGGIMGEIKDALTSGRGVASRWQRILSLGYAPIQIGDMIPSLLVGVSTYRTERDALVRRGLDYAEACREAATRAFIATEETQQSSRVENKPAIVRRGDVGIRLFTMFQSASQLQLSWQSQRAREMRGAIDPEGKHDLLWAIVHAGQDERAAHARRKFAEAFFINHLVLPPLFGLVATILNALLGKKPDEKDALALGAGILLGSMTALPLYAYAMYTAFGILTEGKSYIYKGNRTTAPSLFTTADRLVANGLMTGYDLTHGDLDTAMTDADRFMRAAVSPYRTIRKALDNYSK